MKAYKNIQKKQQPFFATNEKLPIFAPAIEKHCDPIQ